MGFDSDWMVIGDLWWDLSHRKMMIYGDLTMVRMVDFMKVHVILLRWLNGTGHRKMVIQQLVKILQGD